MKLIEKGFWDRNKKLFAIALAIFLISFIAGAVITYVSVGKHYGVITASMKNVTLNNTSEVHVGLSSIDLFIHNFSADLIVMIGGLIFSIPSVLIAILNGFSFATLFGADLTYAIVTAVPHGITEYLGSVLSLLIAFKITRLEIEMIRNRNIRDTLKEHKVDLHDILLLILVVFVLILFSAIIEAHVTEMIANWYFFGI